MELPTTKRGVKSVNPHTLLIYSAPKVGKTTILGGLENTLIIELEPHGADYIEGMIVEVNKPSEFNAILDSIAKANAEKGGYIYQRIAIDTISKLDEWSEITGTYRYMNKPQGIAFNRVKSIKNGEIIPHTSPLFESVHEIPNGFGYKHSREEMTNWYDRLAMLAPEIILVAHIKDKLVESKTGDTVETRDINLTGKVKSIFSSRVDGIGYLHRKDNKGILSFNPKDNLVCGGRCKHLTGDIEISEKLEDGTIKTYWDRIYLKS